MRLRCITGWFLGGGDAGEEGAVLELEDTFGVVVEELLELTVELESEVGSRFAVRVIFVMFLVWSVGIKGALSSVVGVGGATFEGPGWELNTKKVQKSILTFYYKY